MTADFPQATWRAAITTLGLEIMIAPPPGQIEHA
jgi:hypothetical protein